jgi:hypothetical protein
MNKFLNVINFTWFWISQYRIRRLNTIKSLRSDLTSSTIRSENFPLFLTFAKSRNVVACSSIIVIDSTFSSSSRLCEAFDKFDWLEISSTKDLFSLYSRHVSNALITINDYTIIWFYIYIISVTKNKQCSRNKKHCSARGKKLNFWLSMIVLITISFFPLA